MKVMILASGSKGNATYVETKEFKILIDLGVSVKYINQELKKINVDIDDINYILITHLHIDHIKYIENFGKDHKAQICVTPKMHKELKRLNPDLNYLIYEGDLLFNDLSIEVINTSHDSVDARGFLITEDKSSLVYITDTGYLNQRYFNKIKNKNLYIIESNHDPKMLREGKYPLWLQRRILSPEGHLCNEDSATYLSRLIGDDTKKVVLAHLSEENNNEEIALETFLSKMKDNGINFKNVSCARQNEVSEIIVI